MERENLRKIFDAIKSDDVKSFTSLMLSKSDLNISFGRFPLLSVCYLYKAESILNAYEKYLMPINKFDVESEYFEIYKKFKKHAKRSIRLFAGKERVVYPIEMLGVLDERNLIAKKYKFLFKNEEILNNLQKIYNLDQNIKIIATKEKFECSYKKLNLKQRILAGVLAGVFGLMSIFSVGSVLIVNNVFGKGTADSPIYISNEKEFKTALKNGKYYYTLDEDIVISGDVSVKSFSGTIDGKEHTVYLASNSSTLIETLSGTVKNVNIEFDVKDKTFSENYAILTKNNNGNIENCSFYGEISGKFDSAEGDAYVSVVAAENNGTIKNSAVTLNADVSNLGQTNAYLSAFAGVNKASAVINYVQTMAGKIEADTVDLAGIAAENYGTISNSSNSLELSQTSNKEWHPNCAGISMQNYGEITNSVNYAKISSESTRETAEEEQEFHVYAAGIVCNNYKRITSSENHGDISAKGDISISFVGGIVALNVVDNEYSIENNFIVCEITKSKSTGKLSAISTKASVYVGGVAAVNNAQVTYSGFDGVIQANSNKQAEKEMIVIAGGVVGSNNKAPLQNNYANVKFENVPDEIEGVVKSYAAIAGIVGDSRTYYELYNEFQHNSETFKYITKNYYVKNDTIEYSAYGRLTTIHDFFGMEITYSFEKISSDSNYFIICETLEDVPEGVRNVE